MIELEQIVEPLLKWYAENKRELDWRKEIHPYKTWVSEIMLQQTRVEAVKGYFERFMKRLPTIFDLAQIEEEELLKLWEGLGYYNRVRNMQKMAKIVCEQYAGKIPDHYEELIKLPGIGDYTAGAILSIAYWKKVPCVDGNVLRVITRLIGSYDDITLLSTKEKIKQLIFPILPEQVDDFNQSLMELGAIVCLPNGEPNCANCPLNQFCYAYQHQVIRSIPVKTKKQSRKKEDLTVFLIRHQEEMLIEKRVGTKLLESLYQLPNCPGHLSLEEAIHYLKEQGFAIQKITKDKQMKHIFTHIEWNMLLYIVEVEKKNNGLWVREEERKEQYPLPTAFEKLLK